MLFFRSVYLFIISFFFFFFCFFFFQAEDGIRDIGVTGVQTCALPICLVSRIFVKKSVQGSTMLVLRRAFYDERDIENVFDELLGDDDFLDSAEQPRDRKSVV